MSAIQLAEIQRYRANVFKRLHRRLSILIVVLVAGVPCVLLSACESSTVGSQTDEMPLQTQSPNAIDLNTPQVQSQGEQAPTGPNQTTEIVTTVEDNHVITDQIRFTDSNQNIWPPQPEDITNIAVIAAKDTSNTVAKISTKLIKFLDIYNALGARHEILAQHKLQDKSGTASLIEIEMFNYDSNRVVTVTLDATGTEVIDHSTVAAQLYQPPESRAEVARAIELAASHLTRQGFTGHNNLSGTGLLAFPTAVQTAASGASFFAERKIYVTFGEGNGKLPEYRALVNLSTNSVENSGSIQ